MPIRSILAIQAGKQCAHFSTPHAPLSPPIPFLKPTGPSLFSFRRPELKDFKASMRKSAKKKLLLERRRRGRLFYLRVPLFYPRAPLFYLPPPFDEITSPTTPERSPALGRQALPQRRSRKKPAEKAAKKDETT